MEEILSTRELVRAQIEEIRNLESFLPKDRNYQDKIETKRNPSKLDYLIKTDPYNGRIRP